MMDTEKKENKVSKAIRRFLRNYYPCLICLVVMIGMLVAGSILTNNADAPVAARNSEIAKYQNEMESMRQALKQTVTIIDDPGYGLDTRRVASDGEYFASWIKDAFIWKGLDDYLEKRSKYVDDLGPEHSFVRDGGLMQPLESQPLISQTYGNGFYDPNDADHMKCNIVDGPKQYVSGIDEDTGIYSYVAVVYVSGKDNMNVDRKSSVPIVMSYDILPDDGSGICRVVHFTAST